MKALFFFVKKGVWETDCFYGWIREKIGVPFP